jgi:hypothetical protein
MGATTILLRKELMNLLPVSLSTQHQQNIKTVIECEPCEGCAVCNITDSHKVQVDHSAIHIIEIHHILSQQQSQGTGWSMISDHSSSM